MGCHGRSFTWLTLGERPMKGLAPGRRTGAMALLRPRDATRVRSWLRLIASMAFTT